METMPCPTCGKPPSISAYSAYLSAEMMCQCTPPATPIEVTGNLYPPLAYASIAPSLSEQPLLLPPAGGSGPALLQGGAMVFVDPSAYSSYAAYTSGAGLGSGSGTPPPGPAPSSNYSISNYVTTTADLQALAATLRSVIHPRPPTVAKTEGAVVMRSGHATEDSDASDLITVHLRMGNHIAPACRPDPAMPARVRYLRSEAERAPYKVQITGGTLMYRGRPMDTTGARKVIKQDFTTAGRAMGPLGEITNRFLYAMSVDGDIYAADMSTEYKDGGVFDLYTFGGISVNNTHKLAQKFGGSVRGPRTELVGFHHSSFLGGDEVACAGEIEVAHGKLVSINNNSGHYTPPPECLLTMIDSL
ncbi:MAG: hypothetical protein ABI907_13865, partial [Ramlibacter sp.]